LALGDAAAGRAVFMGKGGCVTCHTVENRGGSVGPELSEIGLRRAPESLRLSIVDPSSEIYREYFTVSAVTRNGQRIEGIALNEDDLSIQLRDAGGNPKSFLKENLKDLRREERSLMPSFSTTLSPAEIEHVVAYLRALRGVPGTQRPRTREIARVSENITWLTRPSRDGNERPELLLDALQIQEGATVADLGAGTGYFTWRLARRVGPRGKVIAVDIQRQMLDLVSEEVKKHALANVELVLGGPGDPQLPEGAVDLVLIANAYHEFSDPEAIMASVRRSLKPDGRVVLVEYSKENPRIPISELHRMSFAEIRSEVEAAGFELTRVLDFLPMQHALIFTKRQ
ncbi:MAG: methyltransferase domain-containing protein, partial [Bryobacterales bacterium]|nr:methyltransferase domain-containing protein [Bryobacterales bacterium]